MKNKPTSERVPRRNPPLRRSIGIKLAIVFLALTIIPMSATAYYNLTQGQNEVAEVARENLMELSRSAAQNIGQLLTENQRTSATLAGEPLTVQFLAASEEEREALSPQVYQMLQNFADTHPDYDAPGLLDANGIVLASLAEVLVGKDRSFRDYFQASIQGQPYVSSMLVGRATGRPGVFLTNPVVTAEGEIVGIDIVWLKGDTVWSIIDDVMVSEEGIAYLVDQDGVIIAHPDRDLLYHSLGQLTPEAAATISATIRFGTVEDTDTPLIPQSLGLDDLAAELASQVAGDYRYHSPLDDRDHVVGYTRLEAYPWTVVVDLPEAQFLAPLLRLGRVTWGSVGVVAAMTLIVSILLVRTITRPLHRLTEAASAVERGRPFEPSDIADVTSGRDEIAHLGRVFSNMVLALRWREERIDHLNLVLRAIRNVNQLISRERDRDRLLKSTCDTLIETRGYHNAWIALLDESGDLITTAEAGWGEEFLPLIEQLKRGELTDCGRRALKQSGVVLTEDPPSTCSDCPLSAGCGGREAMAVRLEHGGKVYGLMSASIPADFTTDEEEEFLFAEVAGDIAFALHSIELEEDRKRAEAALVEERNLLRALIDNMPDYVYAKDTEGRLVAGNIAVTRLMGATRPDELLGKTDFDFYPQELAAQYHAHEQEIIRSGQPLVNRKEPLIDRMTERKGWLSTTKVPWRDSHGKIVGLVGIGRDITERVRAEAALKESEEKYRLLAENTLDVIWKMDLNLEFIYANPAILDMLGFTPQKWIGSRLPDHCSPQEMQKMANIIAHELENLETHTGVVFETYLHNKHGEEIACEISSTLVFDETGRPIGLQGTTRDITERKRAAEALQEYSERLGEMVEERTKELREAQEQLVRKEKLAVLGQLAGGVGHELRNPLGVISNAVYFLQMALPDADETTREYLDMISSEVRDSTKIISDLLDFSRTRLPEREEIAVSDLVAQVLAKRPPPEGVEVTTEITPDLPAVFVDPRQIGQVLGNLVTNGYQAMTSARARLSSAEASVEPPDGGGLTITAEFVEGGTVRNPKSQIRIGVSDSGCGIPPENMAKLFEPLFTTKAKGIGLGLAVVKTLVEANGGSIEAESEEGKGSTFTVWLPPA